MPETTEPTLAPKERVSYQGRVQPRSPLVIIHRQLVASKEPKSYNEGPGHVISYVWVT